MSMKWKNGIEVIKETFQGWQEDGSLELGAALSYYTALSLAPLLVIAIGIAALAFGHQAVEGQLFGQIRGVVGAQSAATIQSMIAGAGKHGSGLLPTVLGIATILFGASGVFGQLQTSLDRIWHVAPKSDRGIWGLLRDRFLSFGMVLGVGFLLLVSLVVSTGLSAVGTYARGLLPALAPLLSAVNFVVSFAVVTLLFAMIFRFLPDARVAWRDVWVGAVATALLFAAGKSLIGLYLGRSSVSSSYGAAGSLIVVLLWVYYSSQILFFGAEFTKVWAVRYGGKIRPDHDAIRVQRVEVSEEDTKAAGKDAVGAAPATKKAAADKAAQKNAADAGKAPPDDRSARSPQRQGERAPSAGKPLLVVGWAATMLLLYLSRDGLAGRGAGRGAKHGSGASRKSVAAG
jgi:membrane protein